MSLGYCMNYETIKDPAKFVGILNNPDLGAIKEILVTVFGDYVSLYPRRAEGKYISTGDGAQYFAKDHEDALNFAVRLLDVLHGHFMFMCTLRIGEPLKIDPINVLDFMAIADIYEERFGAA